jgi:hypothetical protein
MSSFSRATMGSQRAIIRRLAEQIDRHHHAGLSLAVALHQRDGASRLAGSML